MKSLKLCKLIVVPRRSQSMPKQSLQTIKMDHAIYQMPHSQLNTPPILLMHGLNRSRAAWRRTARHLSKLGSRRVIAVDARNHGRSPHVAQHTPACMAADLAAFIEDQRLNRIVALGHSMGGRAMMTLALTQPKLVERAIIVDVTPGPLPQDVLNAEEIFKLMLELTPTIPKQYSLPQARKFILPAFIKIIKSDFDLMLIMLNLQKLKDGEFSWKSNPQAILDGWQESMTHYEETLKGLKPYQGETLLIAANKDKFVTPANVAIMKKYFPKLHVEYLDAGHRVHTDQPDKFVKLVVGFTRI